MEKSPIQSSPSGKLNRGMNFGNPSLVRFAPKVELCSRESVSVFQEDFGVIQTAREEKSGKHSRLMEARLLGTRRRCSQTPLRPRWSYVDWITESPLASMGIFYKQLLWQESISFPCSLWVLKKRARSKKYKYILPIYLLLV